MPPPPPPSASYNWVFDSSEEEEEEEELAEVVPPRSSNDPVSRRTRSQAPNDPPAENQGILPNNNKIEQNEKNTNMEQLATERIREQTTPETVPNDEDDEEEQEANLNSASPTANQRKRNKKKKKKKKKKKNSTNNNASNTNANSTNNGAKVAETKNRAISWGDVSMHFFERRLGINGVPLDGGWPLGMRVPGQDKEEEEENNDDEDEENVLIKHHERIPKTKEAAPSVTVSVEQYETRKQEWLLERWNKIQQASKASPEDSQKENDDVTSALPLETRQWDYKPSGNKNPLFGLLLERERMTLLLGEAADIDDVVVQRIHRKQQREAEKNNPKSPSSPANQRKTRSRSGSFEQSRRSRSGSTDQTRGSSSGQRNSKFFGNEERYNSTFTEYKVHHVRNELETLRNQRSQDTARGCTCRKMTVYIPPPNAGKKAAHRRLNFKVLCQELRLRQALPKEPLPSRDELEWKLHDIVEKEGCCQSKNCPCVASGIGCQSDVCQCWHASHQFKSSRRNGGKNNNNNNNNAALSQEVTPKLITSRCGNPNGMYSTDLDMINNHRKQVLEKMPICPVASDD
mmetsp:Transcript_28585/g.78510  ORF Transcript_28585/g.78510 Transcript_28585/m.78510 type:complete len:573 (-) Transcript_28585:50-1768(-)|eukprot:CAMPEP_0168732026 /NCGR_PEP_ID=MMETSP0724-20121128/7563_1 /TAXON_ID=265536 /ORGANISM="Amphiprora sp., Strain CCMP467" /LENGTH=572 /DNA_ID=CAMNT_0008779041 /DNA_START=252 /DNA_END=1970 /DNA_ORIENTATION=-